MPELDWPFLTEYMTETLKIDPYMTEYMTGKWKIDRISPKMDVMYDT